MIPMHAIRRLVFHHSASPRDTTLDDIHRWHVEENGWEAVGYHRVIDGEGRILHGRHLCHVGAHVGGNNQGSIGVCIVGDNTRPGHEWTRDQIAAARRFAGACDVLFPGIQVVGHRDLDTGTECPGVDVRELLFGG